MNVVLICAAATLACVVGPSVALAQSSAIDIAAGANAVSSTASVSIAGLSSRSIAAMPGYPLKAYQDGHRRGRVVLGYTVGAGGTVSDVQVLEAFPVQVFTRSAINAVAGWTFPATGASERRTVEFRFVAE
jgi:TonB family protein